MFFNIFYVDSCFISQEDSFLSHIGDQGVHLSHPFISVTCSPWPTIVCHQSILNPTTSSFCSESSLVHCTPIFLTCVMNIKYNGTNDTLKNVHQYLQEFPPSSMAFHRCALRTLSATLWAYWKLYFERNRQDCFSRGISESLIPRKWHETWATVPSWPVAKK